MQGLWLLRQASGLALSLLCLFLFRSCAVAAQEIVNYVPYTTLEGNVIYLRDYREPALYSGNFADCMDGGSLVDIARFDVAYYVDNMTVIFRLAGTTELFDQTTTVSITISAYGQSRFDLSFPGCGVQANGLCPLGNNETILANGVIPITQQEVSLIPPIALSIPDFDGEAILRIYSNTTNEQIACYATTISNGHSFSQLSGFGATLGGFTLLSVIASFAVATYYDDIKSTRKHYAHSVSVLVIFEVFQSIYLSGAFSVKWPSVLPAWWSNFAWASGMIYVQSMQRSISNFVGVHQSDDPLAAGSAGYDTVTEGLPSAADGFTWYGYREMAGLPIPGEWTGFAATLAQSGGINVENAFITGLVWFLVLILAVAVAVPVFKFLVELLAFLWLIDRKHLTYFRDNWLTYTKLAVLRTIFIAFFVLIFLSLYDFTRSGSAGSEAVAALVFLIVLVGMVSLALCAYYYQNVHSEYEYEAGSVAVNMEQLPTRKNPTVEVKKILSWPGTRNRERTASNQTEKGFIGRCKQLFNSASQTSPERAIHSDTEFTKRFGWLTGRFRNRMWWFFLAWLFYQFVRAIFLAGAVASPLTQIFCCLIIDIIAFAGFLITKPFEAQRLNTLVAYFLGISKLATTVLSITFYGPFNVPRIAATAVGIIIIVLQGVLTVVLVAAMGTGAFTSYWSVTRNEAKEEPSKMRTRYLQHVTAGTVPGSPKQRQTREESPEKSPKKSPKKRESSWKKLSLPPQLPTFNHDISEEPIFNFGGVRRLSKINDDDDDLRPSTSGGNSQADLLGNRRSMGNNRNSTYSTLPTLNGARSYNSLPFGARSIYRSSWSSRDFGEWDQGRPISHTEHADASSSLADSLLLPRHSGDDRTHTVMEEGNPYSPDHVDLLPLPQAYPYTNSRNSHVISIPAVPDRRPTASYEALGVVRPRPGAFDSSPLEYPTTRHSVVSRVSFADELNVAFSSSPSPPAPPPHRVPVARSSGELPRRDDRRWEGQRIRQTDLPVPKWEGPPVQRGQI